MYSIRFLKLSLVSLLLAPFAYANDDVIDMQVAPYLVTAGDPANPIYANAGDNLRNGVGSIFILFASGDGFICTASAISPTHVLTAAHCLRNGNDAVADLLFVLSAGQVGPSITPAIGFSVHPEFDLLEPVLGAFASGDIAVIELANAVPEGTENYALYRNRDEVQKETQHYGHGRSGEGDEGATNGADFFYGRTGKNQYDATFAPLIGIPFLDQLIADFDNGTGKNDAAPWWYSPAFLCPASNENGNATRCNVARGQANQLRDKGFGALEVAVAPGDSGGPGFIDGQIAGIHSFGFTHGCGGLTGNVPDINCELDSSYGEMSGDTRVSNYAPWVDAIVARGSATPVPEPLPASTTGEGTGAPIELSEQARYVLENTVARTLKLKVQ